MNNFQIGQVVRLKSGGPLMTVIAAETDIYGNANTVCIWFADDSPKNYQFPAQSLELAN